MNGSDAHTDDQRNAPVTEQSLKGLKLDELVLTVGTNRVYVGTRCLALADGRTFLLTTKELLILRYLYDQRPKVIPRAELLFKVWGYGERIRTHTLETHIYRLRRKIEPDPSRPCILMAKAGGYWLAA